MGQQQEVRCPHCRAAISASALRKAVDALPAGQRARFVAAITGEAGDAAGVFFEDEHGNACFAPKAALDALARED